jgi:hypothetical protein
MVTVCHVSIGIESSKIDSKIARDNMKAFLIRSRFVGTEVTGLKIVYFLGLLK